MKRIILTVLLLLSPMSIFANSFISGIADLSIDSLKDKVPAD